MKYDFTRFSVVAYNEIEQKAASLFAEEIKKRCGYEPAVCKCSEGKCFEFSLTDESESEDFSVIQTENRITVKAHRLRSLIYGFGLFLRKCKFENGTITLVRNIGGDYKPSMSIRGHQLSYTDMNNTYEAWDDKQFRQYFIDLMLFGNNTIECDSGGKGEENRLMKYTRREAMRLNAIACDELDLDLSVWHPLSKKKTDEETLEELRNTYGALCKLNVLFPPGGDPGDLQAEDFVERCKKMKHELQKYFPDAKMFPSAQAPHCYPDWGERFVKKMAEMPEEIDGIIYGPNHAMPLDELRRKIDKRYPFRFYPDIAHNVRCEIPVHFQNDDWHYAYASTLSREAVNPRPSEYRLLHRMTRQYVEGSVSYSEGVNDDLNKFVWSALDFDQNCDLREAVSDYARTFFPDTNTEKITDALLSLEGNWAGDPAENSTVDYSFKLFTELEKEYPQLSENWRFLLHLFRAYCDKIVRDRRIFELNLIADAKKSATVTDALNILKTDFDADYSEKRARFFPMAEKLHNLIGIQLDVEHFGGMSWERGCTLCTIDNPVTDRCWLIAKLEADPENFRDYFSRNEIQKDEYYFSFAEHGFEVCGRQTGEYYMNFQGDDNFDGVLPMCMTKVYDHFNFKSSIAGLTNGDYKLRITYKNRPNEEIIHHKITINGNIIHDGEQFGGVRDEDFEKKYLAEGYLSVVYNISADFIQNGCAELEITEPIDGFMISEFWFIK